MGWDDDFEEEPADEPVKVKRLDGRKIQSARFDVGNSKQDNKPKAKKNDKRSSIRKNVEGREAAKGRPVPPPALSIEERANYFREVMALPADRRYIADPVPPFSRTKEVAAEFLRALISNYGNSSKAMRALNREQQSLSFYQWRNSDPVFAAAWAEARNIGFEALENEALTRAVEGTEVLTSIGGEPAYRIEKSDHLLMFLMKNNMRQYRERIEHSVNIDIGPAILEARGRCNFSTADDDPLAELEGNALIGYLAHDAPEGGLSESFMEGGLLANLGEEPGGLPGEASAGLPGEDEPDGHD